MALFTPPIDPASMDHGSEAGIARAMQKSLPASYIVMHSLPWVNPARDDIDAPAREGEADFLILHRQYGLLILEVKGGEITLKGRLWYRQLKAGLKQIKDPVRQARRSLWAFKNRIAHICGKAVADQTVISVAVAFPHCLFTDQPPADLPVDAIITMDDIASIEAAIIRAYRAGGGGQKEMSVQDFETVRRALAPEFRIYEPLRVSVETNAEMLARLTRQQLQVLRGFDANPRGIIEGVAGSGKTLFHFALDVNCRNTRRIVACANAAANVASEAFELAPLGRPPKVIVPSNPTAISGLVQAEVRTLIKDHRLEPRQIAIIGPASKAKGPLSKVANIDNIPMVEDATSWREGKGVLCSTARSFKGLEADVVILCDFSGVGNLFTVSDLYVALTRARSFLIIVAHDRAAKERLDKALAAAIATGAEE